MHEQIRYYVCGHTAEGFVNFLDSNLIDIHKIVVLQHPSNIVKTNILKKLSTDYLGKNELEIISSPQNINYIDGLIVRDLSSAILSDSMSYTTNTPTKFIDLTQYTALSCENLLMKTNGAMSFYNEAYESFKAGLTIHDDLEKIYIEEMDFNKADQVAEKTIKKLFENVTKKERKSIIYERLFGTNTPDGVVNHVEQLIEPVRNRIFIKGRAGTGKSVFMKRIVEACKQYGLDVELYRCSFDPNSIDMILIRELDYCLFDSTSPHEFFPTRDHDVVIDLYEETVTPGTDERYAEEINRLTTTYKQKMRKGIQKLQATREAELLREENWNRIDLNSETEIFEQIVNEI